MPLRVMNGAPDCVAPAVGLCVAISFGYPILSGVIAKGGSELCLRRGGVLFLPTLRFTKDGAPGRSWLVAFAVCSRFYRASFPPFVSRRMGHPVILQTHIWRRSLRFGRDDSFYVRGREGSRFRANVPPMPLRVMNGAPGFHACGWFVCSDTVRVPHP
jgi:hypothetical protein